MVNNIKNNKISEIAAKKALNTLNELKHAVITKHKKPTPKHKEVLNLLNNFSYTHLTDKTLKSKSQKVENENENEHENVNENVNENENDKTLTSSNDENEKQISC